MNCNRCGSDEIIRSRRRGIWDRIQSLAGKWPYRCEDCAYRFVAPYRYPHLAPGDLSKSQEKSSHQTPGEQFRAQAGSAQEQGPDMLFETHEQRPHAKIVLQADTHEQLNDILIALNRAVNSYQSSSRKTTGSQQYSPSNAEAANSRR